MDALKGGASNGKGSGTAGMERVASNIVIGKECVEAMDKPRAHGHLAISPDPELGEEGEECVPRGKVAVEQAQWVKGGETLFKHNSGTFK